MNTNPVFEALSQHATTNDESKAMLTNLKSAVERAKEACYVHQCDNGGFEMNALMMPGICSWDMNAWVQCFTQVERDQLSTICEMAKERLRITGKRATAHKKFVSAINNEVEF